MKEANQQKLNSFSLMMIFIGFVIGLGIFRTATNSANAAISPFIFFIAWILGGIVAYCGALTYAEIGSRFPVTGAYYKIFSATYHPSLAFALNGIILISNAASLGGVALIGSEYLTSGLHWYDAGDMTKALIAIVAVFIFYLVNLAGLTISSRVLNILMITKIGMLIIIIAALFFSDLYAAQSIPFFSEEPFNVQLLSLGAALIAVSFTYGGYQQCINFGEEIDSPKTTIPKSYFRGIAVILILYVLVNISYYHLIGFEELKTAKGVAGVIAGKLFGSAGQIFFSLLLFTAVLAYVNVVLMSNPRVMYAMALDGNLPSWFAFRTKSKQVLSYGLTVYACIVVVSIFFAETFDKVLSFVIFLDSIGMVSSAATLFYLRKKTKELDQSGIYIMKTFPIPTLFFMLVYSLVALYILLNTPKLAMTGIVVLLSLILIYFLVIKPKPASNIT